MEKVEDKEYKSPTDEEVLSIAHSPGTFIAKCRLCKKTIRASTIEDLRKHKCQN